MVFLCSSINKSCVEQRCLSSWNLNLSVFVSHNFDEKISCIFISVNQLRIFLVYFAKKWPRPRLFIRFVKILYCSWISKIIMSYVTWTFFCNIMNYWYIFFRMNINIALIRVFDFGRMIAWVFVSFLDFVTFFIEYFFCLVLFRCLVCSL